MGCSHLSSTVKRLQSEPSAGPPWICSVCKTEVSPWLCLCCGDINCGRFVNGHGLSHWKEMSDHCLVLDCQSLAVFCYECDDYVNEDTEERHIEKLRNYFSRLRPSPEETPSEAGSGSSDSTRTDLDELRECHSYAKSPLEAPGIGCSDENYLDEMLLTKRRLRPRKRTLSETSSVENQEKKSKKEKATRRSSRPTKQIDHKKAVGLRNLGNTCFMNAVLQSLSNIKEFCYYFKQLPALQKPKNSGGPRSYTTRHTKSSNVDDSLMSEELRKILISLGQSDGKSAISPESLFSVIWEVVPRFRGYQQQDAHEFLRYMLDRLHTELLNLLPDIPEPINFLTEQKGPGSHRSVGKSSIVTAIFGGTLQSEVRCLSCGTESKKNDPFLDLSLDIPNQFLMSKKGKDEHSKPKDCKLSDCLLNFMEVEELGDTDLYNCSSCRSKQRSTKKFSVRRLPNVLCLHLKRFRWTNYFRTKIDLQIQFPLSGLDMSRYVLPEARRSGSSSGNASLFDLAAVVVHHGTGAGSGHYTAFASHDSNWYHFNDSTVKPTDEDTVAKSKAYILFYVRREFQMP